MREITVDRGEVCHSPLTSAQFAARAAARRRAPYEVLHGLGETTWNVDDIVVENANRNSAPTETWLAAMRLAAVDCALYRNIFHTDRCLNDPPDTSHNNRNASPPSLLSSTPQ